MKTLVGVALILVRGARELTARHASIGLALCGRAVFSRVLGLYFADDELSF